MPSGEWSSAWGDATNWSKRYILPPRRSKRTYPRSVKIKMSNYERKRPQVELAK